MQPRYNRAGARRQAAQPPKRSGEYWARIRDAINREHRVIAALDPRSPRIRPTLAQWVVR